jgi:hypothetical protein
LTENMKEAAELTERAGRQTKHAAKNAGRAAKVVAEPAVEVVTEGVDKLEYVAQDAAQVVRRLDPRILSNISMDVALGFGAIGVSIFAGNMGIALFKQAAHKRRFVMTNAAKANHHIRPSSS